jgi:hypothetical protein
VVRNIADRSVDAPPLRVSLLSKDGHAVARQLADAPAPDTIQPGDSRHFAVAMLDPPKAASDVEVTFALDIVRPRATPAPKLRGPLVGPRPAAGNVVAPAAPPAAKSVSAASLGSAPEARPLPPTSPYALSPHTASE